MKSFTHLLLTVLLLLAAQVAAVEMSVRVAGREVPVVEHRVAGRLNCRYAHFTCGGAVEVEVRGKPDAKWSLSPRSSGIATTEREGVIRFTLPEPRYLVLTSGDERLLLLADPAPPVPVAGAKIFAVTDAPYLADASGARDATVAIQRALDDAGRISGGAVVRLPPGVFTTTGVRVRSGTQLWLEAGAVLRGSERAQDYAEFPTRADRQGISALVWVQDAGDVRVFGHGTLDARGFALAGGAASIEEVRLKARCLTIERSKRVTIEGLLCREATSWTVPFFHCEDVAVRRVKVINDLGPLEHSDGINFCATRRGVVEDCLVHTTDDAFCAKGHAGAPCEDLVFRRLVALSSTRGVKCGQQAYEPMRRVRFEQVDIVRTRDGIDLMHWDGAGAWSDIVFKDIRIEHCERRSLTATVREAGSIRGVRFENISFAEPRPGFLRGKDDANRIEDVVFQNLTIGGKPVSSLEAAGIQTNRFVGEVRFVPAPTERAKKGQPGP